MTHTHTHTATCHCGTVKLAINFPNGLVGLKQCNCSICRRKAAIMAFTASENLEVVSGEDKLSLYTYHTHAAKHYFCSVCGIYTHHIPRSNPNVFGVNVGCIDGIDMNNLGEIEHIDGNNHPMDAKS